MDSDTPVPECFGCLEKVFPMTDSGLRQTPDECFYHCPVKTKCLRMAVSGQEGMAVEEEILKRGTQSGTITFFERWSRKKQLHRNHKK